MISILYLSKYFEYTDTESDMLEVAKRMQKATHDAVSHAEVRYVKFYKFNEPPRSMMKRLLHGRS